MLVSFFRNATSQKFVFLSEGFCSGDLICQSLQPRHRSMLNTSGPEMKLGNLPIRF